MTYAVYALAAGQGGGIWPVSISGWVSLVASLTALAVALIGYGKWIERLNGMGGRVTTLEQKDQARVGAETERIRQLDRILNQHEDLIRQIGEAKGQATEARRESDENLLHMTSALSSLERSLNDMRLDLSQRMTAVETTLQLRGGE